MDKLIIDLKTDTSEIDEAIQKAKRLGALIEEANSLIEELASKEVTIKVTAATS